MSDLISRQEAIKAILGEPPEVNYPIYYAEKIRELPSVQPKERCIATITLSEEDLERIVKKRVEEIKDSLPRKGKWIDFSMSIKGVPTECCSECGGWSYDMGKNFCPNCGCRMEEGDAE